MKRLRARLGDVAELAGRTLIRLPGLLSLGCAVAGTYLLVGLGWALVVAAAYLFLVDRRMP